MNPTKSLLEKLLSYSPGDLVTAMEFQEMVETVINDEMTGFDEALEWGSLLEDFVGLLKIGTGKKSDELLQSLITRLKQMGNTDHESKNSTKICQVNDVEVFNSFVSEAQEHLDGIEAKILEYENNQESSIIHDIFRSIHTIKGVSSFLNLDDIKGLSHNLEYLLDDLRCEKLSFQPLMSELMLESRDLLLFMIQDVNSRIISLDVQKGSVLLDIPLYQVDDLVQRINEA